MKKTQFSADGLNLTDEQFKALKSKIKGLNIEIQPNIELEVIEALEHNGYADFMTNLDTANTFKDAIWKGKEFNNARYAINREVKILKSKPIPPTTEMVCKKCNALRKIEFTTVQTRGGDEGATTTFTCLTCGERWKING